MAEAAMNPRVTLDAQGIVTREEWLVDGRLHRVDGPCLSVWDVVNGVAVLTGENWVLQGQYHRVDGPAYQGWQVVNGGSRVLTLEEWYLEGVFHRVDGPAYQDWAIVNQRAVLTFEGWYLEGGLHRVDGPAWRRWEIADAGGNLLPEPIQPTEKWYLHGQEVDPVDVYRAVRVIREWFLRHRARRERVISALLEKDGMVVFLGLMGLLRRY